MSQSDEFKDSIDSASISTDIDEKVDLNLSNLKSILKKEIFLKKISKFLLCVEIRCLIVSLNLRKNSFLYEEICRRYLDDSDLEGVTKFRRIYFSLVFEKFCENCGENLDNGSVFVIYLCRGCSQNFLTKNVFEEKFVEVEKNWSTFLSLKLVEGNLEMETCFCGFYFEIKKWKENLAKYSKIFNNFLQNERDNFALKLFDEFGYNFCKNFLFKIYPPTSENLKKNEQILLNRLTILKIQDFYFQWIQSTDVLEILLFKKLIYNELKKIYLIKKHKNSGDCFLLVAQFLFTRKYKKEVIEKVYIDLILKLLYDDDKEIFMSYSNYDRNRVDQVFSPYVEGFNQDDILQILPVTRLDEIKEIKQEEKKEHKVEKEVEKIESAGLKKLKLLIDNI